ncbi:hypothetical protein [Nocardioides sp.]|uniref:hypothetical protein n=1 Tax=Nocardioides sp. TaxID=35761 RepID=UPI003D0D8CF3
MTEQRLRELLRDAVADEQAVDLAGAAWERSRRTLRRTRVAVVAGSAAAVALIVGGVAVLELPGTTPEPAPAPVAPPSATSTDVPDADLDGTPVWWAPAGDEEARLSTVDRSRTELPARIDVSAGAPDVSQSPVSRALAVFAVFDDDGAERVVLLGDDGAYRSLDVSGLGQVTKPNGYRLYPETDSMLSPDGRTVMFPQDGHLELYDLAAGQWRRIETGPHETAFATWTPQGQIFLPRSTALTSGPLFELSGRLVGRADLHPPTEGVPLGQAERYGPTRSSPQGDVVAQSWSMGAQAPVPPGAPPDPELLVVTPGDQSLMLALPESDAQPVRWKQCCPVTGWLDEATVVYESRKATPQLIAWTIGTHEFQTLSTIVGFTAGQEFYVASWADLAPPG